MKRIFSKTSLVLTAMVFLNGCKGLDLRVEPDTKTPKMMFHKTKGFDARLNHFDYPYPVKIFDLNVQQQKLEMAYMDISPATGIANLGTVVLLHGKNFGGYYFDRIIKLLNEQGFRVIVPDQIGFGKSSKPYNLQYSFQQLAQNTFKLLDSLKIQEFTIVGHSMGGMLATRMSLMEPKKIKKLIMINPIGLEDYRLLTGYKSVNELFESELQNSEEKIKNYQLTFYYNGVWKDEYAPLNAPAIGWISGPDFRLTAYTAALTSEMIYTQPVVHEFSHLQVPSVLIIGDKDTTAIGKAWASEENKKVMGNFIELGKKYEKLAKNSQLILLEGKGHVPFIEDFEQFKMAFLKSL